MFTFWYRFFPQNSVEHADYWRVRLMANMLLLITSYFLLLTVINIVTFSAYSLALLDATGLCLSIAICLWFSKVGNTNWAAWAITLLITLMIMLFIISAGANGHSLFWATLIPPFAFFLLGGAAATYLCSLVFAVCAYLVYLNVGSQHNAPMGLGSLFNVVEVSIAHIFLFRFYERSRTSAYQQLAVRNADILVMAESDNLTGLYNRDKLDAELTRLLCSAQRGDISLSVMMLDIDFFKKINDQFGHFDGDRVLQGLAYQLKKSMRQVDIVARWGGEEFVILCVDATLNEASGLAQRLRERVAAQQIAEHWITISVGVAQCQDGDTAETLLERADVALYQAKRQGRNAVVAA